MESPYIGRVVTLLQPLFVVAAGALSAWIATEVPGANIDGTELAGLFSVGALAAASAVYKWLDGRSKYEVAVVAPAAAAAVSTGVPPTLVYDPKTNSYKIGDEA